MLPKTNNPSPSTEHRLSVQVSLNGLSFLVSDRSTGETVLFHEKNMDELATPESLLSELERMFFQEESLPERFSEISVVYATPVFTVVPALLFDESKASDYLKFNSKILENDFVAHDVLDDLVVAYVPFVNINNYFFEKYGAFHFYHSATVLLKTLLPRERASLQPKVYLHVQKNSFDCLVIKNGKLALCNNFQYSTAEDFLYYVLFCFEQLKLDPEKTETVFCGNIFETDPIYTLAYAYIRNISILKEEASAGRKPENFILNHLF